MLARMAEIQVCEDHGPYIEWCNPCVSAALAELAPDAKAFVSAVRAEIDAGRDIRAAAPERPTLH